MKKVLLFMAMTGLLLTGCGKTAEKPKEETTAQATVAIETEAKTEAVVETEAATTEAVEQTEAVKYVYPLPDTTMENLTDAILAISLEEGGVYVDDTGKLQMDVKIYTYDKFDMVDIANLNPGDILVTCTDEIEVNYMEKTSGGLLCVNGGQENGGIDLFTEDNGIFFEIGFNDVKSWYEVGEATIAVSTEFEGHDNSDIEKGEVVFYPGDFLNDSIEHFDFTPYNTTIRVEEGQVVELTRRYTP